MRVPSRSRLDERPPIRRCNGKVCYDKRGARTAANDRYDEDHVKLRIYPCPRCNSWHLTSDVDR